MLTKLLLNNFKCFDDHELPLRQTTLIVGRNNAGKSSIVEALRLVSLVINRYQSLSYHDVPDWLDIPRRSRGVSPSLKGLEFNFETVFYRYGDPPALITAKFETNETVKVYIGAEYRIHAVIEDSNGHPIGTKGQANKIQLPDVNILPQVAPLAREEQILTPEYVRGATSSNIAPQHFRNQLNLYYDLYFDKFKMLAENTWPGLRILELEGQGLLPGANLALLVQDGDFVAEVGLMGHGLQMWLQAIWFLARIHERATVILDEPDVYMHADLQRRLIRLLTSQYMQNIVATHSTEIMAEVDADQVLVVDRRKNKSRFTTSLPAVQRIVNHIGGTHNIQLARLWSSKRFVLVEGKDIRILKQIQNILFPESTDPFDAIPNMSIGGWGGWNYAVGSQMMLRNAGGEEIITYCILDSDYHTENDIESRKLDAKNRGVQIHIWSRKEIENFLLIPAAIHRVISARIKKRAIKVDTNNIINQIDIIIENFKERALDAIATELFAQNKAGGVSFANRTAREKVKVAWDTREGRTALVSGKDVLSKLSEWSKDEYGVSFSSSLIAQSLLRDEIDEELFDVVSSIEHCKVFEN